MSTETNNQKTATATRSAARVKTAPAAVTHSRAQSYDISQSAETLDLAKDLKQFIEANRLTTQVQGKDFVNVEGWQYAGSRLGIVPIVEHVINVGNADEMKYQAKVTLFDLKHGVTIGAGFAVCSNKESGKKFYQEFAIMSMAQTRATGKAFRNVLAWIIRAAGYEPTPAEEMDFDTNKPAVQAAPVAALPAAAQLPAMSIVPTDDVRPALLPAPDSPEALALAAAGQPIQYATAEQKEKIIRLLNHPVITRPEKTKMLLNINRLDEERALQCIAKLEKAIDDREKGDREKGARE